MFLPAFWQFLHVFAHATLCLLICGHQISSTDPSIASRPSCSLWILFSTGCLISDGITSIFKVKYLAIISEIFKDLAKHFVLSTEQFNISFQYVSNILETEISLVIGHQKPVDYFAESLCFFFQILSSGFTADDEALFSTELIIDCKGEVFGIGSSD